MNIRKEVAQKYDIDERCKAGKVKICRQVNHTAMQTTSKDIQKCKLLMYFVLEV